MCAKREEFPRVNFLLPYLWLLAMVQRPDWNLLFNYRRLTTMVH